MSRTDHQAVVLGSAKWNVVLIRQEFIVTQTHGIRIGKFHSYVRIQQIHSCFEFLKIADWCYCQVRLHKLPHDTKKFLELVVWGWIHYFVFDFCMNGVFGDIFRVPKSRLFPSIIELFTIIKNVILALFHWCSTRTLLKKQTGRRTARVCLSFWEPPAIP